MEGIKTSDEARDHAANVFLVLDSVREDLPTPQEVAGFGDIGLGFRAKGDIVAEQEPILQQLEVMFQSTYELDTKVLQRANRIERIKQSLVGLQTTRTRTKLLSQITLLEVERETFQHRVLMICAYIERRLSEMIREVSNGKMLKLLQNRRKREAHMNTLQERKANGIATTAKYRRLAQRLGLYQESDDVHAK